MLSTVLNNALDQNSPNTEFNSKIRTILSDLGDTERSLVIRMSTYDPKKFTFPNWNDVAIPSDLGISPITFQAYEHDFNIAKRIFALRDIVSSELGVKVVREGIAVKQARINALQENFDRTESIIDQRKQHASFLAGEIVSLRMQADVLKNQGIDETNQDEYENIIARINYFEGKLLPGVSTGMLTEDGKFDVALATEQRKLLLDVAKEMGDIVAKSNNTSTKKVQKVYDDSTKALI